MERCPAPRLHLAEEQQCQGFPWGDESRVSQHCPLRVDLIETCRGGSAVPRPQAHLPAPTVPRAPRHDGIDMSANRIARCLLCMGELSSAPSPSPCPSWCFETVAYETGLWVFRSTLANHTSSQASFYLFEICKARPWRWGCC